MQKYVGLMVLLFLGACANSPQSSLAPMQGIMKNYLSEVKKFDGIDEREALLLATSELLFQGLNENYYYNRPLIEESATFFQVTFEPINRTLAQGQTSHPIQAIVNKENGNVRLLK